MKWLPFIHLMIQRADLTLQGVVEDVTWFVKNEPAVVIGVLMIAFFAFPRLWEGTKSTARWWRRFLLGERRE